MELAGKQGSLGNDTSVPGRARNSLRNHALLPRAQIANPGTWDPPLESRPVAQSRLRVQVLQDARPGPLRPQMLLLNLGGIGGHLEGRTRMPGREGQTRAMPCAPAPATLPVGCAGPPLRTTRSGCPALACARLQSRPLRFKQTFTPLLPKCWNTALCPAHPQTPLKLGPPPPPCPSRLGPAPWGPKDQGPRGLERGRWLGGLECLGEHWLPR